MVFEHKMMVLISKPLLVMTYGFLGVVGQNFCISDEFANGA